MSTISDFLRKIRPIEMYRQGRLIVEDRFHQEVHLLNSREVLKRPSRTTIINFLLSKSRGESCYLEIGVRNPSDNYDQVTADYKYSVDPGLEFVDNPVDFSLTSDEFFKQLKEGELAIEHKEFDVVFIDGLHLAQQVDRDIQNALGYLKEDGFIVLHDCNPPSEWHAREEFQYELSPARTAWNGTVWKAFLKWRGDSSVFACCIDTDWGVGVISKSIHIGDVLQAKNEFFEYSDFARNRKSYLNLVSFEEFRGLFT